MQENWPIPDQNCEQGSGFELSQVEGRDHRRYNIRFDHTLKNLTKITSNFERYSMNLGRYCSVYHLAVAAFRVLNTARCRIPHDMKSSVIICFFTDDDFLTILTKNQTLLLDGFYKRNY